MSTRDAILAAIDQSRAGNAGEAAVAAALIHQWPAEARALGVSALYRPLLAHVLNSKESELIVCVAEELVRGRFLASDPELAARFFEKADDVAPLMSAYAQGKLISAVDSKLATKHFGRAQALGHIPSGILRHRLLASQIPLLGWVVGTLLALLDFARSWHVIRRGSFTRSTFWRYRDVFPSPLEPVDKVIGRERVDAFERFEKSP